MQNIDNRILEIKNRIESKKINAKNAWVDTVLFLKLRNKLEYLYFKKLKKLPLIGIFLIAINACSQVNKPIPFGLYRGMEGNAPSGTVTFKQGWKDGCESGMAAYGSLHYKAAYDYKYNVNYLDNNEYHAAWKLGFRHCRWYTAEWSR